MSEFVIVWSRLFLMLVEHTRQAARQQCQTAAGFSVWAVPELCMCSAGTPRSHEAAVLPIVFNGYYNRIMACKAEL